MFHLVAYLAYPFWDLPALCFFAFVTFFYLWLVGPFRTRIQEPESAGTHKWMFIWGIVILVVGWASPLFFISHVYLSAHMIQMSLVYFVAPPLILSGLPAWVYRMVLESTRFNRPVRRNLWLIAPLIPFNMIFILYHIPIIFDTVMTHASIHHSFFAVLMASSFLLWWPLVSPFPHQQLQGRLRKKYVSLNGLILMPACLFLVLSNKALFETYSNPTTQLQVLHLFLGQGSDPQTVSQFLSLSSIQDQRWGGFWMMAIHYVSFGRFKHRFIERPQVIQYSDNHLH